MLHRFAYFKPEHSPVPIFIGGKVFSAEALRIVKVSPALLLGIRTLTAAPQPVVAAETG